MKLGSVTVTRVTNGWIIDNTIREAAGWIGDQSVVQGNSAKELGDAIIKALESKGEQEKRGNHR